VRRSNPFRGKWRIVSTDGWEARDLDDLGPARNVAKRFPSR